MPGPRSTRSDGLGALLAGAAVVLLCLVLLRHDPLLFWNDDYELSVLPVMADVARSWSEGQWPLLSPYSWVCSNFAGEFQYGTFSLFVNAAVILIWKLPLTFAQQAAALSITHLFVLAAGAFLLARDCLRRNSNRASLSLERGSINEQQPRTGLRSDSSVPLALFVALVAALNGWMICWGAIDWFGALGAFAWLPWAWWGLERALDVGRSRWRFLWPAPFVYLVITGGFPYTVVMLAILICWLLVRTLVRTRRLSEILPMLFGTALGIGLSAPAWLAIFDYVRGSGRELQPATSHWQWIVPPTALPALILPCWTVKWADFSTRYVPHTSTELSCGLVAPIALLTALVNRGRSFVRQFRWQISLLCLVFLLSLLPTAGMFRWSFRWLPFFHLILALSAAETLRVWFDSATWSGTRSRTFSPGTVAFGVVATTSAAMFLCGLSGKYAFPLTWIFLTISAVWAACEVLVGRNTVPRRSGQRSALYLPESWVPVGVTFTAFLATYLCIPPNCGVPKYNLAQELTQPAPLGPERLYLSVYPPAEYSYRTEAKSGPVGQVVRPGSTSMWGRLHFLNGYSPILAAGVAREFKCAIHGEIDSDTGRRLLTEQADAAGELARLGVDGVIVATEVGIDPQPPSEWQRVFSADEGRVFHRKGGPIPRVRTLSSIDSRPGEKFSVAVISNIQETRNRVEADVVVPNGGRPALVGFSRPFFRGYVANVAEMGVGVSSYRGLFPVVEVPAGARGRLVLSYRPAWLVCGGAVACIAALLLVGGSVAAVLATRRSSASDAAIRTT